MKKQGFTLIEMIAVIVIIALISIITLPTIINQYSNKKDTISDTTKKIIITAAELYASEKRNGVESVTLEDLVKDEKLESPIIDYKTGKEIPLNTVIYLDENGNACIEGSEGCSRVDRKKTYTIQNLVSNGSFETGINGWGNTGSNTVFAHDSSIKNNGRYSFKVSITNAQAWPRINYPSISNLQGHKLYGKVSYYVDQASLTPGINILTAETSDFWPTTQDGKTTWSSSKEVNKWIDISLLYEAKYNYLLMMLPQSNASASGNVYFDGLVVVDLTSSFGAGNEPDKAWCDRNISYFDGKKSLQY